jgi:hypothetical protein
MFRPSRASRLFSPLFPLPRPAQSPVPCRPRRALAGWALLGLALTAAAPAPAQELTPEEATIQIREMIRSGEDALNNGEFEAAMGHLFDALYNLSNTADLFVTRATVIMGEVEGFGRYTPRQHNAFAPGEPVQLYIEPVGMDFSREGENYIARLDVGYRLRNSNGEVIQEDDPFMSVGYGGRSISFDHYVTVTYRLGQLPVGRYTLETILTDVNERTRIAIETPLLIHGPAAPQATNARSAIARFFSGN